jgi:hypothetical protein
MKDESTGNADADGDNPAGPPVWKNAKAEDRQDSQQSAFEKARSHRLTALSCRTDYNTDRAADADPPRKVKAVSAGGQPLRK